METLYKIKFLNHGDQAPADFMDKLVKALKTEFEVGHFYDYDKGYQEGSFNFDLTDKRKPEKPLDYVRSQIDNALR